MEGKERRSQMIQRHKRELMVLKKQTRLPKKELQQKEKELRELHAKQLASFQETEDEENSDGENNENEEEKENETHQNLPPSSPQTPQSKKPSRKQKRLAAKQQADKERREQIQQEIKCAGPDKKTKERLALRAKLHPLGLNFKPIRPDGNCLFSAVVDQLTILDRVDKYTMQNLRETAAEYILNHKEYFIPFMETDDDGFKKYCHEMKTTAKWGGHYEVEALANVIKLPLEIYNADSPIILIGEQYSKTGTTPIRISFHKFEYTLGEHYNSVVPLVEEENKEEES